MVCLPLTRRSCRWREFIEPIMLHYCLEFVVNLRIARKFLFDHSIRSWNVYFVLAIGIGNVILPAPTGLAENLSIGKLQQRPPEIVSLRTQTDASG